MVVGEPSKYGGRESYLLKGDLATLLHDNLRRAAVPDRSIDGLCCGKLGKQCSAHSLCWGRDVAQQAIQLCKVFKGKGLQLLVERGEGGGGEVHGCRDLCVLRG